MATSGAEIPRPEPAPAGERPSGPSPKGPQPVGPAAGAGPSNGPAQGKAAPKQPAGASPVGRRPQPKPQPGPQQADDPALAKPAARGPAAVPGATGHVVKQLRRQQARQLALRLLLFVVLPTALAGVYYGFVATNQYESYSHFTVHSAEMSPSLGLAGILGMSGGPTTQDTLAVRQYVLSRDMLSRLQREHQLIDHYKDASADYLTRLPADATFEEAYEYYRDKVSVDYDTTSGALTLRVRALSPEKAQQFAQAIISYSEEMVNQLSQRERLDQTRYAEQDVEKSEARLVKARQALFKQQQKHAEFNPVQTAASAMSLRTQMEGELARAQADLMQAKAYMKEDSPRVRVLRDRVNALAAQAAQEKRRLVDPKSEGGIADSMAEFEAAAVEKEFAQKSYESAMAALEMAKAQAARQHRYLATIANPSQPDESTYPERPLAVFTVFVLSFLLLGIGSLLIAAVREHARV